MENGVLILRVFDNWGNVYNQDVMENRGTRSYVTVLRLGAWGGGGGRWGGGGGGGGGGQSQLFIMMKRQKDNSIKTD